MKLCCTIVLVLSIMQMGMPQDSLSLVSDSLRYEALQDFDDFGKLRLDDRYFFEINDLSLGYLLRGNVPGMLTTRASGNPLDAYTIVSRGVTTFEGQQAPLYIVDGLPVFSLDGIDPMDVKSIEVEQDIALTARYGLRGSNGIIHIETFKPEQRKSSLRYKTFAAIDNAVNPIEVLSAEDYVAQGGSDFGSRTDWYDEIYQTAFSWAHHLNYQTNFKNTQVAVSGNYRSSDLTLLNTDFKQSSLRLHLNQKALDDRLQLQLSLAGTYRNANPGIEQASRYAANRNPTEPVLDPNNTLYGGYNQLLRFDYFNPVAMLEQITRQTETKVQQAILKLQYDLNEAFRIGAVAGANERNLLDQEFYPVEDLFFAFREGLAYRNALDQSSTFVDAFLGYRWRDLDIEVGYRTQVFTIDETFVEWREIGDRSFSFSEFEEGAGLSETNESFYDFSTPKNDQTLRAYYLDIKKNFGDYLKLNANFTIEGSTRFGVNKKWGNFGGIYVESPVDKLLNKPNLRFSLIAGYGVAGGVSTRSNLSKNLWNSFLFDYSYQNGSYAPILRFTQATNPNLGPERTSAFNIGLKIPGDNWHAKINYFNRRSNNLIELAPIFKEDTFGPSYYADQYLNSGKVKSSGFEFNIHARVFRSGAKLSWNTNFQIFAFTSEVLEKTTTIRYPLNIQGAENISLGEVGEIQALQFVSISDGQFNYEDLNGDGFTCFGCGNDAASIGSGLPNFSIGWQNHLRYGKLEIQLSVNGSFGHRIVSDALIRRAFPPAIGTYNLPVVVFQTDIQNATSGNIGFSDFFFEEASFIRLENLTFRYPLLQKTKAGLTAFIGLNNMITLDGYTGANPEVRQNINSNALLHGKDDIDNYPFTRSIVFGFTLDLGAQSN